MHKLRLLKSWFFTKLREKDLTKNHIFSKAVSILQFLSLKPLGTEPCDPHPYLASRLSSYKASLKQAKKKGITVGFGDSMIDLSRQDLKEVPTEFNFAQSGARAYHMRACIESLSSELSSANVKFAVIGCFGNGFNMGQSSDLVKKEASMALSTLRRVLPDTRIIVYGLPPTYAVNVTLNQLDFDAFLYQCCVQDSNAVFIPLQKQFAKESNPLYPKVLVSADGVHFTEYGAALFDGLLQQAKIAPSGQIVE